MSSSSLISAALLDLTTHRLCRVLRSLVAFYLRSYIIRPDFVLSTKDQVFLVVLSTTCAKYLFPRIIGRNRPATSTNTRARIASFYRERVLFVRLRSFVSLQTLYISLSVGTRTGLLSVVTLCRFLSLSSPRCANLLCISLYLARFSVRNSFLKPCSPSLYIYTSSSSSAASAR